MTIEELKQHCIRQITEFERIKEIMAVTPNDYKRYEEHKIVLQLIEETLEQQKKTGKYDKLKEAVEKIKAEIKTYDKKDRYPYGALGVSTALKIIDNYTEGLI